MEYPPCVIWHHNIESETIKQQPTLTLFMELWDYWWVSSLQDKTQCGLANCDECENSIETSSHCNSGIPFTLWLVYPDDMAVCRCAWGSGGWDCDGRAWSWGTVFRYEESDVCNQDWRTRLRMRCGTLDNPNCKALEDREVVRIETRKWETTCLDTKWECTPLRYRMD